MAILSTHEALRHQYCTHTTRTRTGSSSGRIYLQVCPARKLVRVLFLCWSFGRPWNANAFAVPTSFGSFSCVTNYVQRYSTVGVPFQGTIVQMQKAGTVRGRVPFPLSRHLLPWTCRKEIGLTIFCFRAHWSSKTVAILLKALHSLKWHQVVRTTKNRVPHKEVTRSKALLTRCIRRKASTPIQGWDSKALCEKRKRTDSIPDPPYSSQQIVSEFQWVLQVKSTRLI